MDDKDIIFRDMGVGMRHQGQTLLSPDTATVNFVLTFPKFYWPNITMPETLTTACNGSSYKYLSTICRHHIVQLQHLIKRYSVWQEIMIDLETEFMSMQIKQSRRPKRFAWSAVFSGAS
jgi:hypothetical protein